MSDVTAGVFFQGTWARDHDGHADDTATTKLARRFQESGAHVMVQFGAGTRFGWLGHLAGGITGAGAKDRIRDAIDLYDIQLGRPKVIKLVGGWSRGAASCIEYCRRIDRPPFNAEVETLVLFDTVFSMGVPGPKVDHGWSKMIPGNVHRVIHVLALHETRSRFFHLARPTCASEDTELEDAWFVGNHSAIGGHQGAFGPGFRYVIKRLGDFGTDLKATGDGPFENEFVEAEEPMLWHYNGRGKWVKNEGRELQPGDRAHVSAVP